MRRRSVGVSGASVAIDGRRETNSGMNPYLTRSECQGQAKRGVLYAQGGLTCRFDLFQHVRERPTVRRKKGHKVRRL